MSQLPSKELLRSRRLSNGARGRPESILKWGSALAVLLVGAAPIVMASQIDNKSAVAHLFTTNGTAKLAHQLKSEKELISEYNFRTQNAKAFWAGKARAGKPVTFSAKSMSITTAPDGVVSLKRDGKVISGHDTAGWRIYKWTTERREGRKRIPGETTKLDNMAQVAPNEFMLWSSKRPFLVNVAIKQKDRYFTFELLHVSNDPKTGGLNNDWPGHRVEFDMRIDRQDDGWLLNTLLLNPYSELNTRTPHKPEPGIGFKWPYPQWSQTDDRP